MAKSKGLSDAVPAKDEWEHESNARTLMDAGKIMSDPQKLKGAQRHLRKQKKVYKSVDALTQHYNETYGPNGKKGGKDNDDGPNE